MKLLHIILRLDFTVTLVVGITVVLAWSYSEFGSESDPAISVFQDRDKLGIWDALWAVNAAFGCLVIALVWRRYSEKRRRASLRRSTDLEPAGIPPISPVGSTDQDLPRGTKGSINDTCVVDGEVNDVMPFTNIGANGPTRGPVSKLDLTNFAVDPIPEALSAGSSLPGAVAQPLPYDSITPREISFSPTKPIFRGYISEPKGLPSHIGGFSDVWRCRVRFSAPSEALPQKVAVKVLRPVFLRDRNSNDSKARLLQRLKRETRTWAGLDHPNIVPLIGWTEEPSLSLISPWYEQGNLDRHVKNLSEFKKLRLLLEIAKGLEYLHSRSPPVVHGDLKPVSSYVIVGTLLRLTENPSQKDVLLSDRGEPLLTDFGLSTILGEEEPYCVTHHVGGSTRWISPEYMLGELGSCESDVYSFGSLAFTVMTGTLPHAGLTDPQIVLRVCNSKDPKGPVEDWSKYPQLRGSVKDLLEECWAWSPPARPSMSAVIQQLSGLLESCESGAQAVSTSEQDPKMGLKLIWLLVSAVTFICLGGSFVIGRFGHSAAAFVTEHLRTTLPTFVH